MKIDRLSVNNFRNLKNSNIEFKDGINILYGDNAQGKTNVLEAIYMCATGRSHRTHSDREIIAFGKNEAHIQLYASRNNISDKIDVHLKKECKKGAAVNNIPVRKLGELFGVLHTVIFAPEDLQLIKSGPSERRRFMDLEMCQISNVYYYDLQQYYRILKQRNNLLKKIQKDKSLKDTVFPWDIQLLQYGRKVIKARSLFIDKISPVASEIHSRITDGKEKLEIFYKPSVLEGSFENKLLKSLEKDIYYGSTSSGPHKDDITFAVNGSDVRDYGSQGQQRTASLSSKLAEIEIIREERNVNPVLLLDDVLSELDEKRQRFLMDSIKDIQTVITCTGIEDIIGKSDKSSAVFRVENGSVSLYK